MRIYIEAGANNARAKIDCLYVEAPHESGVSHSRRVLGEDEKEHLVKFNAGQDRTAINELVCNQMAECFELPVFEAVLANLNDEHCDLINGAAEGAERVEPGEHFGTRFLQPFYTVDRYQNTFGDITQDCVANLHQVPDILGFDSLVQNSDRHCCNVCVLNAPTPGKLRYFIFDHGHAFGGPCWDAQSVQKAYQNMQPVSVFCMLTPAISGLEQFDRFLKIFDTFLKAEIDGIFQKIPDSWGAQAAPDLKQLKESIRGTSRADLEAVIKKSKPMGGVAQ